MDIEVYNTNFELLGIIDDYESLVWTIRYCEEGSFDLVVPVDSFGIEYLNFDNYLRLAGQDTYMIIENRSPVSNAESGSTIAFSGRSLESILRRRIVWSQTTITGNLQNGIRKLMNDAFINPVLASRKVANLVFNMSSDTAVTGVSITDHQYTGDELYDVIKDLCEVNGLGFNMHVVNGTIVFTIYKGKDRTTSQIINPAIEFSSDFNNLISSKLTTDTKQYKNAALIAGEDEGTARKTASIGTSTGLDRRELFVDARDISTNNGEISLADYNTMLINRGTEKLVECGIFTENESEVDNGEGALYNLYTDYYLGDIVDVMDDYGNIHLSRVEEVTTTVTASERSTHPVFTNLGLKGGNYGS